MTFFKKAFKRLLIAAVCVVSFMPNTVISAQEPSDENLALNKPVTASAEYSTLPASNLTDGNEDNRWSSEKAPTQWAYVDLGQTLQMDYFSMVWESASVFAEEYNIYVADSTDNWGTPVVIKKGNASMRSEDTLSSVKSGRYVKLEITKMKGYPSVSCRDFKIKYTGGEVTQNPAENVALGKTAKASSIEAESLNANKAFDGDTTSKSSRWSSNVGNAPHWIYVDLGAKMNVKTLRLFWETRKATAYEIQTADTLSEPMNDADWTTVKSFTNRPSNKTDKIILDNVVKARYVRLYISDFTPVDPDTGISWNTISLYEIEVYGGEPKEDVSELSNRIEITPPLKGDKKLQVKFPESSEFDISYNGTDYNQVIDEDLTIYEPVVDTTVKASFKLVNKANKSYIFKEFDVVVPGTYTKEATDNAAPVILPELREWKGTSGVFEPKANGQIMIADEKLRDVAETFAKDYKEITGKELSVTVGSTSPSGSFYFSLTSDTSKGLKKEGYLMDVTDSVKVESETTTGAFWATRTILQSLKATSNIPKGISRDYPMYEVRGFILDVGRKTFTMDYLEQIMKEMSWYKLNDFQIHLNDNLIFLEYYTANGLNPMDAYSGFRLESDIKKGGNNGLNQADLTNTDVFYTKDEFRNFIEESRVYGVNVVPEIDTPAHSLALTKVRPDLRHGTNGRDNDHLNLSNKYEESIGFVKDIFNEYMGNDLANPVFDKDTIIHVGADEYNANHEAFRRFSDDMLEYVQDTGRKARIWGSLSVAKGQTPVRSKDVQMNLWNYGYANFDKMYEDGFDLINCNDGDYYSVPNAGYYYDYLSNTKLYNLDINTINGITIPAGDKQMVGGAFAVWNDMVDYKDNGVSEYDVYERIQYAMPLFGAKLWGKGSKNLDQALDTFKTTGSAPGTNFRYEVESNGPAIGNYPMDSLKDTSNNANDLKEGKNASLEEVDYKNVLALNGSESYVSSKLETIGLGNDLRVKVKRTSDSSEDQILFESNYGSIKAVQKDTGKVGLTRENFDYSFDYELPMNEWVELEFKNTINRTELYVNGKLIDVLGDDERVDGRPLLATMMIPFERIGSKTNAFIGYVDDVRLGITDTYNSTMELDYAVWNANQIFKDKNNQTMKNLINQAKEIFREFAPDATEIKDLADQINAITEAEEFKKADYSRVDAYRKLIPADLSIYTDASVSKLNNVLSSIREGLPITSQGIVDGYEKQLAKALQELVIKDGGNVNYIDNARLTATASSHQDNSSAPSKVLDNDSNTMWHSKWSELTMPHWIDLEIDTPEEINALTYVPRQTGVNGNLTKYEIQISNDGINYTKIKEGTLANNSSEKVIEFDSVTTKHIRLVYVTAINNNASASAIKLHNANVVADVDGLKSLINKATSLENAGYTEETWNALQESIKSAQALVDSQEPDANEVELMKKELTSRMTQLVLSKKVDASSLEELLKLAEAVDFSKYTDESVAVLQEVIAEAKALLLKRAPATQAEVDAMILKLQDAMNGLKVKTPAAVVDTGKLKELLTNAKNIDKSKYTAETVANLEAAVKAAQQAINNANTQEEIDEAYSALLKAIAGLKHKSTSAPSTSTNDSKQNALSSGDNTNMIGLATLMTISGLLLVIKRRKQEDN